MWTLKIDQIKVEPGPKAPGGNVVEDSEAQEERGKSDKNKIIKVETLLKIETEHFKTRVVTNLEAEGS